MDRDQLAEHLRFAAELGVAGVSRDPLWRTRAETRRQPQDEAPPDALVMTHDPSAPVMFSRSPADALAGIHIFFPDPWPKKRHHKRRLLQPGFVHELALRLESGGYLHAVTDWQDYAAAILTTFAAEPALRNTAKDYAERPAYRPLTKFERRGLGLGHGVWDIVFRRR